MRRAAFETRFDVEPALVSDDTPRSFGLIHEFWQQGVVVTMAAFKTGDLSLYFSSGGGILCGIQHDKVAETVRKTIPLLGALTPQLERSDEMERPEPGEVTFTIITTDGRYRSRLRAMPERNPKDANFQLLALSQGLISELRKASEGGVT